MRLFIDDERITPPEFTDRAWTVEEAIQMLESSQQPYAENPLELVSFDYDAHPRLAWTFMQVLAWMRDANVWPKVARIHTANYWQGRGEIKKFLEDHGPADMVIEDYDPNTFDAAMEAHNGTAPEWVLPFIQAQQGRVHPK